MPLPQMIETLASNPFARITAFGGVAVLASLLANNTPATVGGMPEVNESPRRTNERVSKPESLVPESQDSGTDLPGFETKDIATPTIPVAVLPPGLKAVSDPVRPPLTPGRASIKSQFQSPNSTVIVPARSSSPRFAVPPPVRRVPPWFGDGAHDPESNSAYSSPNRPTQKFDPRTDENGNDLPSGVVRSDPTVKLGPVDPQLKSELPNLRDRIRQIPGHGNDNLIVTSGHRDRQANNNAGGAQSSRHLYDTAVDIEGPSNQSDFNTVGLVIRDQLTKDFGPGNFRIGGRNPDGSKPAWADFLDPNPNHYHIDLGRNSTYDPPG